MIRLKDILNELFATDLIRGADRPRMVRSQRVAITYGNTRPDDNTYITQFTVIHPNSSGGSGRQHTVEVMFDSYNDLVNNTSMSEEEKIKYVVVAGDVKVKCTCEDFLYKGFAYMGTQMDYSLMPETRPPVFRNPNYAGSVCKHCLSVLRKINLFYGPIAKDITILRGK